MAWKKMLALVTGQIKESLRRKLKFVLEENRRPKFPTITKVSNSARALGPDVGKPFRLLLITR